VAEAYELIGLVAMDPAAVLPITRTLSLENPRHRSWRSWRSSRRPTTCSVPAMVRAPEDVGARTQGRVQADRRRSTIKAKIRQLRQQRSRKRMMAAVPTASVIITNPTHYAIALHTIAA